MGAVNLIHHRAPKRNNVAAKFEAFWQVYPKHVGKGAAFKVYRAAIGKKTGYWASTPEELLDGAVRYAAARRGKDPQYTMHAANWLKGGHWTDEVDLAAATTTAHTQSGQPDHIAVAEELARQAMAKNGGGHVH
jgi:hypothetical protein